MFFLNSNFFSLAYNSNQSQSKWVTLLINHTLNWMTKEFSMYSCLPLDRSVMHVACLLLPHKTQAYGRGVTFSSYVANLWKCSFGVVGTTFRELVPSILSIYATNSNIRSKKLAINVLIFQSWPSHWHERFIVADLHQVW